MSRLSIAGIVCLLATLSIAAPLPFTLSNPYEGIAWETVQRHRANLHTHTTESDGSQSPAVMIDAYRERGYTILALTDHDYIGPVDPTWPWERFGRKPQALDMLAVQGNEISNTHHIGSYFNAYGDPRQSSEAKALKAIGERNGLAVLFHPGRYHGWRIERYLALFRESEHLLGIEVSNQGNRYPHDWKLWDRLLQELMPERPVWAFANDDAHRMAHVGRDWQDFFLTALTEDALRRAMRLGHFTASHSMTGKAPMLRSLAVDKDAGEIRIDAPEAHEIVWTVGGEQRHRGPTLSFSAIAPDTRYVRASLVGPEGYTFTQPLGIAPIADAPPEVRD